MASRLKLRKATEAPIENVQSEKRKNA